MVCTCLSGLFVAEGISQWLPSALKVQRLVDTLPNISIYQGISCLWKSSENTLSWEISISISQKATSLCGLKLQKCLRMSGWKSWKVEVIRFGFASCFAQEGSQMVGSFFLFFTLITLVICKCLQIHALWHLLSDMNRKVCGKGMTEREHELGNSTQVSVSG